MREAHRAGAVVAGSSAGAAVMSDPMIGAGDPADALRHGVVDEDGPRGVWVRDGMGFLDRGITGQHFFARGRLARLLVALAEHPEERLGLGVGENTAAIVEGKLVGVAGEAQVAVVAKREAGFDLWLLAAGDRISLHDLSARPATHRPELAGDGPAPEAPRRPFHDGAAYEYLLAFARSGAERGVLERRASRLVVERAPGFRARGPAEGDGPIFAGPFRLSLDARYARRGR
jgi:hypothetical protein